jgi:hypothetical protein
MKANLRSRNIAINSYVGMLAITLVGGFATILILHVINDVPLSTFASTATYQINSSL